jgi:hypothetical protein
MTISLRILLRIGNVSDGSCRENENMCFMFNNVEKCGAREAANDNIIWGMNFA